MASLRLISYNCKNFGGCHSDLKKSFISELFNNCDFLLLQEHWLYTSQFHMFDDIGANKTILYNGISAMDSEVFRQGRPHGGCVIIWSADIKYNVCKVNVISNRFVCVSVTFEGGAKVLLFNVYMPTDDRNDGENLSTYQDVLAEISHICNNEDAQFVIVAGDFNTDMERRTMFVNELAQFCGNENMTVCSSLDISKVEYTYESSANYSRSLIDQVLISNNFVDSVVSHFTVDGVDNASDHLAVVTHLNVNCEYLEYKTANHVRKTAWYKASISDIQRYKEVLDRSLENVRLPNDCINCVDSFCAVHADDVEMLYNDIIDACMNASKVVPCTGKSSRGVVVPGWKEFCDSERKVAIYWHNAWKVEGRPKHGFLAEARRRSRLRFHKAVKLVKRHENAIRSEKMAQSITADCGRHFWSEARAMRGKSSKKLPPSIDDVSGDVNIADHFAGKFCNIYNGVDFDRNAMNSIISDCNGRLSNLSQNDINVCLVNETDIERIVNGLKKGKADGNIGFFSDHVIHGTPKLFRFMSVLINCMMIHGISPRDLLVGTIIPIPKNKRLSVTNSDNFRGICLQNVICKIIDLVMLSKEGYKLQTSDNQFGFKSDISASTAAAVVHETLDYYVNGKGCVYALALDATKAFDRVEFCKLFSMLLKRNVNPLYVRLLYRMYVNQQLNVSYNNHKSYSFNVSNGVKQGGVLSPTLFTCYVDGVIQRLKSANVGCYIGDCFTGCVAYADDIILLAPSVQALRRQISIVEEFAQEYSIKFNGAKSKLLCVTPKMDKGEDVSVKVGQQLVPCVDNIDYLGHFISRNRSESLTDCIKKDFVGKFNSVLADFSNVRSDIRQQLVEKYCYSLYGSHFCDFQSKDMSKINIMWRKSIRRTWHLPYRTHSRLLPFIADCMPFDMLIHQRFYKFFEKNLKSDNCVVACIFQNAVMSKSRLGRNYRHVRLKYGANFDITSWLDSFNVKCVNDAVAIRDLTVMKERFSGGFLAREQCMELIHALCLED